MTEQEYYNYLVNNAPSSTVSATTQNDAVQLASLESNAPAQYQGTYQQAINNAVSNYLQGQGYSIENDNDFKTYRKEFTQGAQKAADNAVANAAKLSGETASESAQIVANEGKNAQMENINDIIPQFEAVGRNIASAENSRNADKIGVLNSLDTTEYTDAQNAQSNYLNMLGYGLNKYSADAQLDIQRNSDEGSVYQSRLGAAQSNLADRNNYYNNLYSYNTQSADSKAQIAENEYENNQKIAYNQAKDAYDTKVAAAKAEQELQNEEDERRYKRNGSKFIDAYNLKGANYEYQLNQVAVGYYEGYISLGEMNYIAEQLNMNTEDIADKLDFLEQNNGSLVRR